MTDKLFESIQEFLKNPDNPEEMSKLLTEDELNTIIESYITNHEEFTEDEITYAVRWAEDAVIRYSLLGLVLKGFLKMTYEGDPDNFVFSRLDK